MARQYKDLRPSKIFGVGAVLLALVGLAPIAAIADYETGRAAAERWDMDLAVKELRSAADTDSRAALLLYRIYRAGFHAEKTERSVEALKYLKLAAQEGNAEAKSILGQALIFGSRIYDKQIDKDAAKALVLLEDACQAKVASACKWSALLLAGDETSYKTAAALPHDQRDSERAKQFGSLWRAMVLAETDRTKLYYGTWELAIGAGKAWSGISIEEGAAYFALSSLLNDGSFPYRWPQQFQTLTAEQLASAKKRAEVLEQKFEMGEEVSPSPQELAERIANAVTRHDEGVDQLSVQSAQLHAAMALLNGEVPKSIRRLRWDRAWPQTTELIEPYIREQGGRIAELERKNGLDRRIFLERELPKALNARRLRELDRFFSGKTGERYLLFRRVLNRLITEAAVLSAKARYQRNLRSQIPVGSDPYDEARKRRDKFMADQLVLSVQLSSLGTALYVNAMLRMAGKSYEQASKMLSFHEMDEIDRHVHGFVGTQFHNLEARRVQEIGSNREIAGAKKQALLSLGALLAGEDPSLEEKRLENPYARMSPAKFAEELYAVSTYTGESFFSERLANEEIKLLASDALAKHLASAHGVVPHNAPASWEAMIAYISNALRPIAAKYAGKRDFALNRLGFDEKTFLLRQYERQIEGRSTDRYPSREQLAKAAAIRAKIIQQILTFHQRLSAKKWRTLWPDLRAYAAEIATLHQRIDFDPALGPSRNRDERVKKFKGVRHPRVSSNLTKTCLGRALLRMDRFPLPLGTVLRVDFAPIEVKPGTTVHVGRAGSGLPIQFVDERWITQFTSRLSASELQEIDDGLTSVYDKEMGRWFGPLVPEWSAYRNMVTWLTEQKELQRIRGEFSEEVDAVADAAWESWK